MPRSIRYAAPDNPNNRSLLIVDLPIEVTGSYGYDFLANNDLPRRLSGDDSDMHRNITNRFVELMGPSMADITNVAADVPGLMEKITAAAYAERARAAVTMGKTDQSFSFETSVHTDVRARRVLRLVVRPKADHRLSLDVADINVEHDLTETAAKASSRLMLRLVTSLNNMTRRLDNQPPATPTDTLRDLTIVASRGMVQRVWSRAVVEELVLRLPRLLATIDSADPQASSRYQSINSADVRVGLSVPASVRDLARGAALTVPVLVPLEEAVAAVVQWRTGPRVAPVGRPTRSEGPSPGSTPSGSRPPAP